MLTVKRVDKARAKGRYYDVGGVRGLCLQVSSTGARSWLLRYQLAGEKHWMGLGSYPDFSLAEARERARRERQKLADGIDPLSAKRAERAARNAAAARTISFREAAEQFHRLHAHEWRNKKHADQVINTLRDYAFPHLGGMAVTEITTADVLKVIEPIWISKSATAVRTRGRIEAVLGWAQVRGYRSGDNPARWRGHLDQALPKPGKVARAEHHAALSYHAVPGFMAALRLREGVAARALEFLVLTAARSGEVLGARWDEIDLTDNKVWTIPGSRMKGGRAHVVPLAPQAIALLQKLPREGDGDGFVFVGSRAGSGLGQSSMAALLGRMGHGDITAHGFRSSFRDWAAECTNFSREVAEQALAHAIESAVEKAYRRGSLIQKRRQLAEAWAKYCSSPPIEKTDDKTVVPMHPRGSAR
jgi:integrase